MKLFATLFFLATCQPALAGPGEGPRPHFGASQSLTEEEEARVLEQIAERNPERAAMLPRVKVKDPARYYEILHRMARSFEREARDPEARVRHERTQSIRHEIKALAIEWQGAEGGEKKKLRREMEKLAAQVFDLRQEERRGRLVSLRERLAKAESEVEEQDANRDAVIAEHLDKLLEHHAKP